MLLLLLGEQVQIKSINFIWWHSLVGYKKWRLIFQRRNSFGSTLSWSIWLWMSKIQVKMEFLFHFVFILLCIQNTKHSWYRSILMGCKNTMQQNNSIISILMNAWLFLIRFDLRAFRSIEVIITKHHVQTLTNAHNRSMNRMILYIYEL